MTVPIATTAEVCVAHASVKTGRCSVVAQYNELHHVIPVEWQKLWQPPQPWEFQGQDPYNRTAVLFDARTEALCRTGHGNVHFWLARLMHAMPAAVMDPQPLGPFTALAAAERGVRDQAKKEGRVINSKEFAVSKLAIQRWTAVGGSIGALILAGKFGGMV